MAVRHTDRPHVGVQFHPESFLTDAGRTLLGNFLRVYCGLASAAPADGS